MKKNDNFLRALVAGFVLFMISGTLVAQNYAFKCNFDVPSGQEVFPVTLTNATAAVSDGLLKVTLNGTSANPHFTSKDLTTLAASTTTYKYLNIRMKNSTSGVNFKVLWLTSLKPGTYLQKLFNNSITANDADFVSYSFDLTDVNYTGNVKLFRIDCPINGPTTGFVEYDYIGLSDSPIIEVTTSKNASTLGLSSTSNNTYVTVTGIGALLTINTPVSIKSLIVAPGAKVTLTTGNLLTVTNPVVLQSDVTGTGTLVDNTITDPQPLNATVQQNFSSYRSWYMSSPVVDAQPTGMNRINYYDETDNGWKTLYNSGATAGQTAMLYGTNKFERGKGYQVVPDNDDAGIQFGGTLHTGAIPITLTRSGTNVDKPGFNLIGNPYPSYLDWAQVNTANTAILQSSTMWYRTKKLNQASELVYQFWTVNGDGVSSPNGASQFIPPMQAFWVRTIIGGGNLQLTNTMRSHAPTTDYLFKAPAAKKSELQLLRLQVSNGTNTDEAVIYFSANASNSLDSYDSPKMSNEDENVAEIFTRSGNEQLVINAMNSIPKDTEITLGFVPGTATSFSIKANELSNLPSDLKVILKDKITLAETDLTDGISKYDFNNVTTVADRFSVIFRTAGSTTGLDRSIDQKFYAYSNNKNQLTVSYISESNVSTVVNVFNSMGQCVVNQNLISNTTIIKHDFKPGVYVVKVNNTTRKVIIK